MQAVYGWWLVVRQSERDHKPAIWATDGRSYVWVADIPEEGASQPMQPFRITPADLLH